MRRYPFVPRSTSDLQLGDLFAVRLTGGDLAVLQVRGLKTAGSGAYTHFVAGVVDWRAPRLPVGHDLRGRRVLAEGVVRFEVFAPGRAEVFGTSVQPVPPPPWSDLAKAFAAGTSSEVWAWKSLRRRAQAALAAGRSPAVQVSAGQGPGTAVGGPAGWTTDQPRATAGPPRPSPAR